MAWSKKGNQVNGVEVTSVEFENQGGIGYNFMSGCIQRKVRKAHSQLRQSAPTVSPSGVGCGRHDRLRLAPAVAVDHFKCLSLVPRSLNDGGGISK